MCRPPDEVAETDVDLEEDEEGPDVGEIPAEGDLLVGVADTPPAAAAVTWAAQEAARRGTGIRLVHGLVVPEGHHPGSILTAPRLRRVLEAQARRTLAEAALRVRDTAPGCRVHSRVVEGDAVAALHAMAEGASLVVIGSDGLGPIADRILGGVARGLCEHLDVPVVVVPHGQDPVCERGPTSRAPVVVGDDGSASCAPAVRFAVDRARDRRAPLIVVRIGDVRVTFDDPPEQAADAGVAVRVVVADDRPDRVLLDQAREAETVVLGHGEHSALPPRRHTRAGVVVHATCPVVVVPPSVAGGDGSTRVGTVTARS